MRGDLRAFVPRVDGVTLSANHAVVDAILDIKISIRRAEDALVFVSLSVNKRGASPSQ